MITPDDIRDQRFLVALRGYDRDEVSAFLEQVASEVANLQARTKELEALLAKERNRPSAPAATETPAGGAPKDTRELLQALGTETTRILVAAEESAREIEHNAQERARAEMEQARRSARDETERASRQAAKLIADAERRRDAIAAVIRDLEAQRDRFVGHLAEAVGTVTAVSDGLASAGEADEASEAVEVSAGDVIEGGNEAEADLGAATDDVVVAPDAVTPSASYEIDADETEIAPSDGEVEAAPVADAAVAAPAPPTPDPAPPTPTATDTVAGRRDASLDGLRGDMARKLRRGLQDVQNGVLEAIRTAGSAGDLDRLLPGEPALDDLGAEGQHFLAQGYEAGLIDAAAEVGGDAPKHLKDGARLPAASATMRAVLAHEVVSGLRATLRAGLEADEPETSLSERVGEVFRDLKGPVLEGLVATHLDRIYGHGLLDGWQELGIKRIRWQVGDEPRCPEQRCRSNAEEGPVELGIDFPSGDRVPPAHQGCTCVIVPEDS